MAEDADLPGLELMPPQDQEAIGSTLGALLAGFMSRDADALVGVYADDADWTNAFGTSRKGSDAIVAYLRGLFADPNFDAGRPAGPPESRLRKLADTAVAVSTRMRILDQGLAAGGTIPARDNHSLRLLVKQPDGRWLIVTELYMDARTDATYAAGG